MTVSKLLGRFTARFGEVSSFFHTTFRSGFPLSIRSRAEERRQQKQEIILMLNRKKISMEIREENLRKEVMTKMLLQSVLSPQEYDDAKKSVAERKNRMTEKQLEDLDQKLHRAERIKRSLTEVVEGKKPKYIADMEILILNWTSRKSLLLKHLRQTRDPSGRRIRKS